MIKGIRGFFSNIRNTVTSFFSPLTEGVKGVYERVTHKDSEDIKDAISQEEVAETVDDIADDVSATDTEASAELEDIADIVAEENAYFAPESELGVNDAIDDFWSQYDVNVDQWEAIEGNAISDENRYHMEITYTAMLNDGSVVERTIERYNFYDEDIIKGMAWEDLFHQGDGDGGDIDTGEVASLIWSVSSVW